ncbi:Exosome complex exonuclease RRP44 [Gryllus bimaculatus]|nr:Exosome complex exonuclease RRP44 [Gryllus bimaculatus]
MLTTKTFLKKTKRGNILKIVREHYLREDIWCGSALCDKCPMSEPVLSANPESASELFSFPHYIVLDTCVVVHQIDVLEEKTLCNVIIPQTVIEEVKHQSSTIYKRLKDIIGNPGRNFYVFVNEHHMKTYIERQRGETANDRNDRAIRKTVAWYQSHLASSQSGINKSERVQILLLTNDGKNKELAAKEGLCVASVREYIQSLVGCPGLQDKLAVTEPERDGNAREYLFPPHLPPSLIHDGIKSGKLLQGTFYASRENFLEGHVNVEGQEKMWSSPSDIVLQDEEDDPGDILDDRTEALSGSRAASSERIPTGRVVGIIRRKWRQYCGILQPSPVKDTVRHIFVPAERKIPKIRIETRQSEVLASQRIIVAIDSWPRHSRYPSGHFVRALGPIGDKDTENEVLLLEHDVPHSQFSEAVNACLPKLPWIITDDDVAERQDLRHIDVCSVDPPGCTDIDDALHCRFLDNGHVELLSSNLCSLRGNEERFAFSCVWEMTREARIVATRFHKSIIRSRAALTYEQAQLRIDDPAQKDAIATSLRELNRLAKILKRRRIENGALVLASPEIRFQVDSETHDPIEVEAKKLRETNSMVEEFMLLANISVAEKIVEEFPECAMLRRHPEPPVANFEPLVKAGHKLGFNIVTSTGKELAASLDEAVLPDNPYFNTMLRILATRCMMQAVYFTSGMLQPDEFFHYGLACPIYTHFTSPIRRYADIIVHRLLAVCIGADSTYSDLLDKRKSHALCHNLNYRNRMAQYAGRASVALHTHLFFRGKVQDEEGYVLFVRKNALQILIPKYGLEGTLYVVPKKGEVATANFVYNEEEQTQKCGDVTFRSFDPVTVQLSLDRSNLQHEKLVLKLVKPVIPGFSVPSSDEPIPMAIDEQDGGKRKDGSVVDTVSQKNKSSPSKKKRYICNNCEIFLTIHLFVDECILNRYLFIL